MVKQKLMGEQPVDKSLHFSYPYKFAKALPIRIMARLGSEKFLPCQCLRDRVAAGHFGRKTGCLSGHMIEQGETRWRKLS